METSLKIGALALVASLTSGATVAPATEATTSFSARGCSNYCTSNESGTQHRTASSGVGISDPSTHGWQESTCGDHHLTNCSQMRLPDEFMERLENAASDGDIKRVRALVASVSPSQLLLDEASSTIAVQGCGGKTLAVVFISEAE